MDGAENHPELDHFSVETHAFGDPLFKNPQTETCLKDAFLELLWLPPTYQYHNNINKPLWYNVIFDI